MTKAAIITGASGGIGQEVAKRLAADGFSVVLNYSGSSGSADKTVGEIKASGGSAVAVQANVSDEGEVRRLFERALSKFGQLHTVVHSAGIMPLSPIVENNVEQFDKVIATNLRGTFLVLAQAARHVADGGRILALSSSVIAKSTPT